MDLRYLFGLALVVGSVVFLTGAWNNSPAPPAEPAKIAFVPQSIALDADIIGSGIDARQLLQKAIDRLTGPKIAWLKTKIRQTMTDTGSNFVAEGILQRGPNHCARLTMDIATGGQKRRLLVVSDGEIVAQVREASGAAPSVTVESMPSPEDETIIAAAREAFLTEKSCGGPRAILAQLHQHLQNGKLQTGLLDRAPVIQIKGEMAPTAKTTCACTMSPLHYAYVYLDAGTLWPHCIEWWGTDKEGTPRRVLRVEFLESDVGRELSEAECAKVFSYRPE